MEVSNTSQECELHGMGFRLSFVVSNGVLLGKLFKIHAKAQHRKWNSLGTLKYGHFLSVISRIRINQFKLHSRDGGRLKLRFLICPFCSGIGMNRVRSNRGWRRSEKSTETNPQSKEKFFSKAKNIELIKVRDEKKRHILLQHKPRVRSTSNQNVVVVF